MEVGSFSDSEISFKKHMTGLLPNARRSLMSLPPNVVSNLSKKTDYKYREAVDRLRHLLQQYSPDKSVHFSPEVSKYNEKRTFQPLPEELNKENADIVEQVKTSPYQFKDTYGDEIFSLVKGQDDYINHLEEENTVLRKELTTLEDQIVEVIAENEKLLSANRQTVTKKIIGEVLQLSEANSSREGKNVQSLQSQSLNILKTYPDDKQHTNTSKPHLCGKCDLEATIQANLVVNVTLQRISKERDELLASNLKLKTSLQEMREREKEAENQVKKGIDLVEQTAMEKQQVELQNNKLEEEMENQRGRLEKIIAEYEAKLIAEKDNFEKDYQGRLIHAQSKFEEAIKDKIEAEHKYEQVVLEKENLNEALEQIKIGNQKLENEIEKIITDLKGEIAKEVCERGRMASELNQLKAATMRERREQQQETEKLQMEADVLRRHCNRVEQDLLAAKEECLQLTQAVCDLRNTVSFEELAKQSGQRIIFTDLKALKENFRSREEQLNNILQQAEDQQALVVNELDTIAASQTGLITQLTNECRFLSENSRHVANKYKNEVISLRGRVQELSGQLEQSRRYRQNMELQCEQHRRTHHIMRQQLHHLEDKLKTASKEIDTLLSSQQVTRPGLSNVQHFLHDGGPSPRSAWNDQYMSDHLSAHNEQLQFFST